MTVALARSATAALREGAGQVARAWRPLLASYAWNVALALPLALFVHDTVRASLGSSLAGDRMKSNWDSLWYASFSTQTQGVASTFRPSVSGAGAVLDALDTFLDGFRGLLNGGLESALWPVLVTYWLSWSFLSGGFVSLFVDPDSRVGFMTRAARMFPRVFAISVVGLLGYALVFGWLRGATDAYLAAQLRDVSDERVHFAWTLAQYAALWMIVLAINIAADYAKVFAARAAAGPWSPRILWDSLSRSARFLGRHAVPVTTLYLGTGLVGVVTMGLYLSIVPGALDSTAPAMVGTFLLGQVYVVSRIALRCLFYAGEACLVRRADPSVSASAVAVA